MGGWADSAGPARVSQLRLQPLQRTQTTRNARIDDDAKQHAQSGQRHQHCKHEFTGYALLHSQAFCDLQAQAMGRIGFVVSDIQHGHAHIFTSQVGVVNQGLTDRYGYTFRRRRQLAIAQHKTARRGRHHLPHTVRRVLLQHILRGTRKVHL